MLHQKYITLQEYQSSTEKNEYQYFFKKDDELEGDENEGIVEYGNDFINYKFFLDKIEFLEENKENNLN